MSLRLAIKYLLNMLHANFYVTEAVEFALSMDESDDDTLPVVTFGSLQAGPGVSGSSPAPSSNCNPKQCHSADLTDRSRKASQAARRCSDDQEGSRMHSSACGSGPRNTGGDRRKRPYRRRRRPTTGMRAVQNGEASNSRPAVYNVVGGCCPACNV